MNTSTHSPPNLEGRSSLEIIQAQAFATTGWRKNEKEKYTLKEMRKITSIHAHYI